MGIEALIIGAIAAGVAGGVGISKAAGKSPEPPKPQPLPQAPSVDEAANKASEIGKKKRAMQTQSIYTSPLGASGEANIIKKTLTGQ